MREARTRTKAGLVAVAITLLSCGLLSAGAQAAELPIGESFRNSIGMELVRVEPGTYKMGQVKAPLPWELLPHTGGRGNRMDGLRNGDFDEYPVHQVKITEPFYIGKFEVTNAEYEQFDRTHAKMRGFRGFSSGDDEAVLYVSWYDARAFCRWLSEKEGLPYRLPTEAEWEYACRAGTTSHYYTGEILSKAFYKNQHETKGPEPVSVRVGMTPPNRWGIYDMHGNVEEWCHDWYGPYKAKARVDPVGYADGQFRVARGGSHGTQIYSLRSANRQAALPETRNWMMGFRVVLGQLPDTEPLEPSPTPLHQRNVQERSPEEVKKGPDPDKPYFKGPRKFVKIPNGSKGPLYAHHNHDPALAACPNGDLLAVWYSCLSERNRELTQAASRLREGAEEWDQASLFFNVPDRNDHAPAMAFDGDETLYYFTGVAHAAEHGTMAMAMRTSKDSGATWSEAQYALSDFTRNHMPSESIRWLNNGLLALAQDGPRSLWMSGDGGVNWFNPGGNIRGIHPGFVQLEDGRLLGYGRGNEINGMMPKSVSADMGRSFSYSASQFPPVGGGQRLVLMRLQEGPLFFASFADEGIMIEDRSGEERRVRGLFTAVSTDEGKTWPHKRLVTDDGPGKAVETKNGVLFLMSGRNAERGGYLAAAQSSNGVIHLISSRQHYAFNLNWLMTKPPPLRYPPVEVQPVIETFNGSEELDEEGWVIENSFEGGFNGEGQYRIHSYGRGVGLNRILGKGSFEMTVSVENLEYTPPGPRTNPGFSLNIRDVRTQEMTLRVEQTHLRLNDDESLEDTVTYETPPRSASIKMIYHEETRKYRLFYGLNGEEPIHEMPQSKDGLKFEQALSETTNVGLLVDQGSVELDHFEIEPLED